MFSSPARPPGGAAAGFPAASAPSQTDSLGEKIEFIVPPNAMRRIPLPGPWEAPAGSRFVTATGANVALSQEQALVVADVLHMLRTALAGSSFTGIVDRLETTPIVRLPPEGDGTYLLGGWDAAAGVISFDARLLGSLGAVRLAGVTAHEGDHALNDIIAPKDLIQVADVEIRAHTNSIAITKLVTSLVERTSFSTTDIRNYWLAQARSSEATHSYGLQEYRVIKEVLCQINAIGCRYYEQPEPRFGGVTNKDMEIVLAENLQLVAAHRDHALAPAEWLAAVGRHITAYDRLAERLDIFGSDTDVVQYRALLAKALELDAAVQLAAQDERSAADKLK
jgi:hypothetical protein